MKTIGPPITICIPTFNQASFLESAVRSAVKQSYRPTEILISDDASPDATEEVMEGLLGISPDIRYHRHHTNLGMVGNYDWIVRQADTELIAMFDGDDVADPEFVEELARLLDKHPGAGYAHCAVRYIDGDGQALKESRLARMREYMDGDSALRRMVYGKKSNPSFVMFRRKALEKVNFFQGRPQTLQDYDLLISISDAGYGNVYSPRILGSYRIWGGPQWSYSRNVQRAIGLDQIYTETLQPAFRRRGWSERPIRNARRREAAGLIPFLASIEKNTDDREKVAELLLRLSPSWWTRIIIKFSDRLPLQVVDQVRWRIRGIKESVKRIMFR